MVVSPALPRRFRPVLAALVVATLLCQRGRAEDDRIVQSFVTTLYVPEAGEVNPRAGHAVASLGDLNGDGVADAALSAPHAGATGDGKVFILFHEANGYWSSFAEFSAADVGISEGHQAQLGTALCRGAANGDGTINLAVSSLGADVASSPYPEGALHVVRLNASGLVAGFKTYPGSGFGLWPGDAFGAALAFVGDWDGDGAGEVLVGAPGANASAGCLFLHSSGGGGDTSAAALCAPSWLHSGGGSDGSSLDAPPAALGPGSRCGAALASVGWGLVAVGCPGAGASGGLGRLDDPADAGFGALWLVGFDLGPRSGGGSSANANASGLDASAALAGGGRGVSTMAVDVSGLGLAAGDGFGSSVALLRNSLLDLSPADTAPGDDFASGGSGGGYFDLDLDSAGTLDLAVGAPFDDSVELDGGAV